MRLSVPILAILLHAASAVPEEVIVLSDGTRMTVKGYEVKETVVVITTLEGKLRSLPRGYVNLEATRASGGGAKQPSGARPVLPEQRTEKIRWGLEHYGAGGLLDFFVAAVDEGASATGNASLPDGIATELKSAVKGSFGRDRIYGDATEELLRQLPREVTDEFLSWLASPETREVLSLEQRAFAGAEKNDDDVLRGRPQARPPSRMALVERMLDATDFTGAWHDMYVEAMTQFMRSLKSNTPEPLRSFAEAADQQPNFGERGQLRGELAGALCDLYASLAPGELERYVQFWESPRGRTVSAAIRSSLVAAFRRAGVSSGEAVANVYRRYLPDLDKAATQSASEPRAFPELGFRFTPPAGWAPFDVSRFSTEADLGYIRSNPNVVFMIVAEKLPGLSGVTNEAAASVVQAGLASRLEGYRLVSETAHSVEGMDGVLLVSEARLFGKDAHYLHWIHSRGEHVYQLVAWGLEADADLETIRREAFAAFAGFDLLDAGRENVSSTDLLTGYHSDLYGYDLRLAGTSWSIWEGLAKDAPSADHGGLRETEAFVVIPVHLDTLAPSIDVLAKALLARLDIDWSGIPQSAARPIENGTGYVIDFAREVEGVPYDYRMKVWKGEHFGYLVAGWTSKKDLGVIDDLLSRFRFDPAHQMPKGASFDETEKTSQALVLNDIGIHYFDERQYGSSSGFFSVAADLSAGDPVILQNLLSTLCYTGRFEEALSRLDARIARFPDNLTLLSYRPFLLARLGGKEEAATLYRKLFARGYQNDDDLSDYAELLWEMEREDEAVSEVEAYRRERDSVPATRLAARLYRRREEYDRAAELLRAKRDAHPTDAAIAQDLIEVYYDAGMYRDSLSLANGVIERGGATAEIQFLKGRAELALGAYPEAKTSFRSALDLDPSRSDVREHLDHVSGLMGQGDQEPVRRPVEAVPLPESLLSLPPPPEEAFLDERGAYYAHRATAISFRPGEDYRRTERFVVRVREAKAVATFSSFQFELDPLAERLYVNELRVLDEKGSVVAEGDPSSYYVSDDTSDEMATEEKLLTVPVPGLAPGYSIELTMTWQRISPPRSMPFVRHTFSSPFPVQRAVLYLTGEIEALRYYRENVAPETVAEGAVYWVSDRPPLYRFEEHAEVVERYLPFVWVGDRSEEWESIGRGYLKDIQERLPLDQETRALARSLVEGRATKEERVEAIADYVQRSYTYKAIEFGRRAWLPNPASQIVRNKYGDCKDHSVLFYSLLTAIDEPAQLVLLSASSETRPEVPSLDQFDHMIVFASDYKGGHFFDLTDKNHDVAALPPLGLGGRTALLLDPARPRLVPLPEYPDDSSKIRSERTIEPSGRNLVVEEVLTFEGYYGAWLRSALKAGDAAERRERIQRYLESGGRVLLEDLSAENLTEPKNPFVLRVRYRMEGALHEADEKLIGNVPAIWERTMLEIVSTEARRTPYRVEYPLLFESEIQIEAPAGYLIASKPSRAGGGEGSPAEWKVASEVSSDRLWIHSRNWRPRLNGSAEEYRDLVAATESFLDAAQTSLVLAKAK
jgi:tetratricopeptide (TPR) repeat protein/transglutaminase-like putative cysteine protease